MSAPTASDPGREVLDRQYSLGEASRLLGLSRRLLDGLIAAGFVSPSTGPRGSARLGFQDLVVLRAAQGLASTRLSAPRIARTLARLRKELPDVPPGRLRVEAVGKSIVVRQEGDRWQAETGQYLLAFDITSERGEVRSIGPGPAAPETDWLERALELEDGSPDAAHDAYRRAIGQDAHCSAAYANLGRLLHAGGRIDEARAVYEAGLQHCDADATLVFNLGVLLEDVGDQEAAASRYREALAIDPTFADAHCNLGLLYERVGDARGALRHLAAYRALSRDA